VVEKRLESNVVILDCTCGNQHGEVIVTGTAEVVAPTQKVHQDTQDLPEVQLIHHDQHDALLHKCDALAPTPTAVVYPCNESSLRGAVEAAEAGLIAPVLIGPAPIPREIAATFPLHIAPGHVRLAARGSFGDVGPSAFLDRGFLERFQAKGQGSMGMAGIRGRGRSDADLVDALDGRGLPVDDLVHAENSLGSLNIEGLFVELAWVQWLAAADDDSFRIRIGRFLQWLTRSMFSFRFRVGSIDKSMLVMAVLVWLLATQTPVRS